MLLILRSDCALPSGGESELYAEGFDVRQAQLFLDDGCIESSTLVERVLHEPIQRGDMV